MKPFHRSYQPGYSELQPEATFDREKRRRKAGKILSVLEDHLGEVTKRNVLLDVGCSTGTATALAERSFGESIGIDIDRRGNYTMERIPANHHIDQEISEHLDRKRGGELLHELGQSSLVKLILELVEREVPEFLDRGYYERRDSGQDYRGYRLERLAIEMYARGLSTRDIEEVLRGDDGSLLLGRSSVSEVTEVLWAEYEAFSQADLSESWRWSTCGAGRGVRAHAPLAEP